MIYIIISLIILVPGIFSLARFGLKPAIDFTGGSLLELKMDKTEDTENIIRAVLKTKEIEHPVIQPTNIGSFVVRFQPISKDEHDGLVTELKKSVTGFEELRYETTGPSLGKELLYKTFVAAALAVLGILLYVAWAFKNIRFGVSAIIALFHDVLIVIGIFSLLGIWLEVEVDALFVTAILTTMSFSVHDTIVVFDRIREYQKKSPELSLEEQINHALTETMSRSLNNSLTIIFMLLALVLLGGETIKWFALALLIGTISGTYSSPFIATPVLYTWSKLRKI